ncbi:hypothetical protein [Bacillus subtilis]|uniref:hypothetical protein n=1 Tax=Bacillus subtilis TaxID=1423 RepID=UPI002AA99F97|nr:hypothetical protein [Bacillus subtilis]MDY7216849.1 hypothetical protein [Bacillus subtilis]
MDHAKLFHDLFKALKESNLDLGNNREIEFKFDGADLGLTNQIVRFKLSNHPK